MRDVDGLLFDLDGTLWSPLPLSLHCWTEACNQCSVSSDMVTIENLETCFGQSPSFIKSTLVGAYPPAVQQQVCDKAFALENEKIAQYTHLLYPKVRETLEHLAWQFPLFIVSNCQAGYIEAFLETYHLAPLFADYHSSGETGLSKSQNIKHLVQAYALRYPFYIGDTASDAEAASLAHVAFIHASYGFGTVPNAEYVLTEFSHLPALLAE